MSVPTDPQTWLEEHLETTPDNEFFWQSGHEGELRIQSCTQCAYLIHPPAPYCPRCEGREVAPRAVSGRATLYSYTLVHHGGVEGEAPTVVAMVQLEEQEDLRLMSNLVDLPADRIEIGMPLQVRFRTEGRLSVPVFGAADASR